MKLVAVAVAALVLSACGAKSTPAAPGSAPSGPPTSTTALSARPWLDCAKPSGKAQQLVCEDPQLTGLDRRLHTAYQQALDRPGADSAAVTAEQNRWAAQRDDCEHNADPSTCLQEGYQTRLVQLAIADPATVAPPVIDYRCPADRGPLTAQFYNQFDPPAAVLNWKGDQLILFVEPSGSGARYGRQGIQYWEHQGEVRLDSLDFNGTTFVCTTA